MEIFDKIFPMISYITCNVLSLLRKMFNGVWNNSNLLDRFVRSE